MFTKILINTTNLGFVLHWFVSMTIFVKKFTSQSAEKMRYPTGTTCVPIIAIFYWKKKKFMEYKTRKNDNIESLNKTSPYFGHNINNHRFEKYVPII